MLNPTGIYTYTLEQPLADGDTQYGTAYISYEVRQVTDVRDLTCTRAYRVTCSQRIVLPNQNGFAPQPRTDNAFNDYPALLTSRIELAPSDPASADVRLLTYAPRTLNASVATSANESQSTSQGQNSSAQYTSGSSTSQTNSYGGSVTLGPMPSVTGDYSNSQTTETSTSTATGTGTEQGTSGESGGSDSMSIKDWASYAYLDTANTSPTWVWAQEFPWDVIKFHWCPGEPKAPPGCVILPSYIGERFIDVETQQILPPSHLALFGVDFVMKAAWLLNLSDAADETLTVDHSLSYLRGSHFHKSSALDVEVTLDVTPREFSVTSPPLDLTLLGLDPVQGPGTANGAVIGFIPGKFVTPPPSAGSPFKILSNANTLQVTGSGFDDAMSTSFTHGPVTLTVQFKVVDDTYDYALFLKHWKKKTSATGCTLEFIFNGDTANPVYRHVDALEGEGGNDNLDIVNLRNKDYASIDFHDYLVWGLNTVAITVTPEETSQSAGYVLRAIAIGES